MAFKVTLVLLISISIASGQMSSELLRALFGNGTNIAETAANDVGRLIDQILEAARPLPGPLPRPILPSARPPAPPALPPPRPVVPRPPPPPPPAALPAVVDRTANTANSIVRDVAGTTERLIGQTLGIADRLASSLPTQLEDTASTADTLANGAIGKSDLALRDVGNVFTTALDKSANTANTVIDTVASRVNKLLQLINGLHIVVDDTARTADVIVQDKLGTTRSLKLNLLRP